MYKLPYEQCVENLLLILGEQGNTVNFIGNVVEFGKDAREREKFLKATRELVFSL